VEAIATHDLNAAAARVKAPVLFIHSGRPATDVDLLRRLCPQVVVGATVGTGHWLHLETPDQVNAMIDRFLAISGLASA
jgi:pimeloyl-ACP methyl ester carboxylesterase